MTTPETKPEMPPAAPAPARRRSRRLVRHFMMQLLPVTAGILIALLIDGVLESRRQDKLVAEAHAGIAAEVADNAKALDNALPSLDTVEATLNEMLQAIDEILASGTTSFTCCDFGLVPAGLTRASWESAERTGALGYMDYAQVREYASLYAAQDTVLAAQTGLLGRFPTLASVGGAINGTDEATRLDDLRRGRATIVEFLIAIGSHRVMARGLRGRYHRIPCYLEECPPPAAAPVP
jgi:hypothetical protein